MKNFNGLDWLAVAILVVGGINWGMIAAFNIDLVSSLFGEMTVLTRSVYALVGLAAIYTALTTLYVSSMSSETRIAYT
jgi:uncharacterized protein